MHILNNSAQDSAEKIIIRTLGNFQSEMNGFISLISSFVRAREDAKSFTISSDSIISFRRSDDMNSYLFDIQKGERLVSFVFPVHEVGPSQMATWNGVSMIIGDRPLERPAPEDIVIVPEKNILPPDVMERKAKRAFEKGVRRVVGEYIRSHPHAKILYKIDPENPERMLSYEPRVEYYIVSRNELQVEIDGQKLCNFRRHSLVWGDVLESSTMVDYVNERLFENNGQQRLAQILPMIREVHEVMSSSCSRLKRETLDALEDVLVG